MKGMVFTELLSMAEQAVGEDVVDEVLDSLPLSSGGAYNAVGNYPCSELMMIVGALSERTGAPVPDLQRAFGTWMLGRFAQFYPDFFRDKPDPLTMLEAIEDEVHVEVRKLYPDAGLPTFDTKRLGPDTLQLTYRSSRALVPFCHGLIDACVRHFGRTAITEVEDRSQPGRADATFTIRLAA